MLSTLTLVLNIYWEIFVSRDTSPVASKGAIFFFLLSTKYGSLKGKCLFSGFFLFEMGLFCNTSPLHSSGGYLGWEDTLEEEMITHSSFLAGRTPWAEEPGGLQSMGSQRDGHD